MRIPIFTPGEWNNLIVAFLHVLARQDARIWAVDSFFHAVVEQNPALSIQKFMRYNPPRIAEQYCKEHVRKNRRRQTNTRIPFRRWMHMICLTVFFEGATIRNVIHWSPIFAGPNQKRKATKAQVLSHNLRGRILIACHLHRLKEVTQLHYRYMREERLCLIVLLAVSLWTETRDLIPRYVLPAALLSSYHQERPESPHIVVYRSEGRSWEIASA